MQTKSATIGRWLIRCWREDGDPDRLFTVNDGDDSSRPFGDVAIRSLFNDADDFGDAIRLFAAALPELTEDVRAEIGKLIVAYAGVLAHDQVLSDAGGSAALAGVLSLATDSDHNIQALGIDFTDKTWDIGDSQFAAKPEETALVQALLTRMPPTSPTFKISPRGTSA